MGVVDSIADVAEKGIDKITSDKEKIDSTTNLVNAVNNQDNTKIEADKQANIADGKLMSQSKFPWWLSHNAIVRYIELFCAVMIVYSFGLVTIVNDVSLYLHNKPMLGIGDKVLDLFMAVGVYGGYNITRQTLKKKL